MMRKLASLLVVVWTAAAQAAGFDAVGITNYMTRFVSAYNAKNETELSRLIEGEQDRRTIIESANIQRLPIAFDILNMEFKADEAVATVKFRYIPRTRKSEKTELWMMTLKNHDGKLVLSRSVSPAIEEQKRVLANYEGTAESLARAVNAADTNALFKILGAVKDEKSDGDIVALLNKRNLAWIAKSLTSNLKVRYVNASANIIYMAQIHGDYELMYAISCSGGHVMNGLNMPPHKSPVTHRGHD